MASITMILIGTLHIADRIKGRFITPLDGRNSVGTDAMKTTTGSTYRCHYMPPGVV